MAKQLVVSSNDENKLNLFRDIVDIINNQYPDFLQAPVPKYVVILSSFEVSNGDIYCAGYIKNKGKYVVEILNLRTFIELGDICHFTESELNDLVDNQDDTILGDIAVENIENSILEVSDLKELLD